MVSRKRKREDKAKTKLKKPKTAPGKHLPKGTNVTKTEFKVAKINIPGQKVEAESSASVIKTSKKIGLKDILTKLNHFSLSTKCDGLEGLRELLQESPSSSLISDNLSSLLASLMPLSHDIEKKLRKLSVPLITQILSSTPPASLAPLHNVILAHLGCALTHIDQRIQQDGLLLLDSALENAEGFIRENYSVLLPNCLDQISSKKKPGSKKEGTSLAANVSEEMTALNWRLNVLSRVEKVLDILSHNNDSGHKRPSKNVAVHTFKEGMSSIFIKPGAVSFLSLSSFEKVSASSTSPLVKQLVPLVLETWIEARANDNCGKKKGSLISKDVHPMLSSVAGILDKLQNILDSDSMVEFLKFSTDLAKHLLNFIPFAGAINCDEANIQLGLLALFVNPSPTDDDLDMLVKLCSSSKSASSTTLLRLISKLHESFERLSQGQKDAVVLSLIELSNSREVCEEAFSLLHSIGTSVREGEIVSWISNLPDQFLELLKSSKSCKEEQSFQLNTKLDQISNSCLALVKTKNTHIVDAFEGKQEEFSSVQEEAQEDLRNCIKYIYFYVNRMRG